MRLIVFDVDGTWTDTVAVDPAVFCKLSTRSAVLKTLIRLVALRQRPDAGIYLEIFTTRIGRASAIAKWSSSARISSNCSAALRRSGFLPLCLACLNCSLASGGRLNVRSL